MKVILIVLCSLLLAELSIRLGETAISENALQISQFSEKLSQSNNDLLILGNSLSGEAFGRSSQFTAIVPDGTSIYDWFFLLNHNQDLIAKYNVVVIGFAWGQLSDQETMSMERLGGYFSSIQDLSKLNSLKPLSFDQNADFVFSNLSKLWLYKVKLGERFKAALIPDFQNVAQMLNGESRRRNSSRGADPVRTYQTLGLLLDKLAPRRVILIAMPVQTPYQLDARLGDFVEARRNVDLLDFRATFLDEGMSSHETYKDAIHVSEGGAELLTRQLSAFLAASNSSNSNSGTL